MVSPEQTTALTIIKQGQFDARFSLAFAFLIYYDYILTLSDEIDFFWSSPIFYQTTERGNQGGAIVDGDDSRSTRINYVTALFLLNRYIPLAHHITTLLLHLGKWTPQGCNGLFFAGQILFVVVEVTVNILCGIRVYALYGQRKKILWLFSPFFICGCALGLWCVLSGSVQGPEVQLPREFGCHQGLKASDAGRIASVMGIIWAYDVSVFALMLWKSLQYWKLGSNKLIHIILRDGSLYFLVLISLNTANILFIVLAPPILKDLFTICLSSVSVTLISRMMINLKKSSSVKEDEVPNSMRLTTSVGIDSFRVTQTARPRRGGELIFMTASTSTGSTSVNTTTFGSFSGDSNSSREVEMTYIA